MDKYLFIIFSHVAKFTCSLSSLASPTKKLVFLFSFENKISFVISWNFSSSYKELIPILK